MISDDREVVEDLKDKYFIKKYITSNMHHTEFEMWAKIAFKSKEI